MLTEKDYCDYETSRELKELGFVAGLGEGDCGYCLYDDAWHDQVNRPLLYEAQKWMRNTHNLHISTKPYPCEDGLMWMYEIRRFTPYLVCVIKNKTGFQKEEEALLKGIKEGIESLKEEK